MNMAGRLQVDVVENGFIVTEMNDDRECGAKMWEFESSISLAEFMRRWGSVKMFEKKVDVVG